MEKVRTDVAETLHDLWILQQDSHSTDVKKWLTKADVSEATIEELNDDQIITVVQTATSANDKNDTVDTCFSENVVSHSAAKNVFVLKYIEQQPKATPINVM